MGKDIVEMWYGLAKRGDEIDPSKLRSTLNFASNVTAEQAQAFILAQAKEGDVMHVILEENSGRV